MTNHIPYTLPVSQFQGQNNIWCDTMGDLLLNHLPHFFRNCLVWKISKDKQKLWEYTIGTMREGVLGTHDV